MMGKFYSQDPRQYLFYYTCYYSTDPDICDVDYLDIILRKKQHKDSATNELDLGQVPWHMIAADLKNIYNMEFTNDKVMFQAKGPVCDFNGNIVTNAAGRWRLEHFVLLIVLLPIYIYNIPMYY
ncbi:uncharacterized protein LOC132750434 [Ruditapes philippinarum]|uniref:uncharacterized protein LOC132750434 n=1 Tax=Ruditapes philippinarum TaxID=129788 RepID=UPI00295B038F|nr:uncharacterized protein LOC132750434 [Ruditapes philippinarum]